METVNSLVIIIRQSPVTCCPFLSSIYDTFDPLSEDMRIYELDMDANRKLFAATEGKV